MNIYIYISPMDGKRDLLFWISEIDMFSIFIHKNFGGVLCEKGPWFGIHTGQK